MWEMGADKKLDYLSGNMGIDTTHAKHRRQAKPSAPPDLENGSEGKVREQSRAEQRNGEGDHRWPTAPRFSLARNLHGNALRPSGTATVQQAPAPFLTPMGIAPYPHVRRSRLGDPEGSRTLSQPRKSHSR